MTLKVGIHSFLAWRSAFKTVSVEIGRQVRLSMYLSLGKVLTWLTNNEINEYLILTGLLLYLRAVRLVEQVATLPKTEKVPSLSPGRGILTNKWTKWVANIAVGEQNSLGDGKNLLEWSKKMSSLTFSLFSQQNGVIRISLVSKNKIKKIFTFRYEFFRNIFKFARIISMRGGGGCPPSPSPMVPKPITTLKRADLSVIQFAVLLVYLPSCLGQETAKWSFRSSSQAANYVIKAHFRDRQVDSNKGLIQF